MEKRGGGELTFSGRGFFYVCVCVWGGGGGGGWGGGGGMSKLLAGVERI